MENAGQQSPYGGLAGKVMSAFSEPNTSSPTPASPDLAQKVIASFSDQPQQAPSDVTNAQQQIGNQDNNGYCQRFVEQVTGSNIKYPTAVAAFNANASQGKVFQGLQGAKPGDIVYFSPNEGNENDGHVGIISGKDAQGNPQFVSATDNGVQNLSVNDWLKQTGQSVLGYMPQK